VKFHINKIIDLQTHTYFEHLESLHKMGTSQSSNLADGELSEIGKLNQKRREDIKRINERIRKLQEELSDSDDDDLCGHIIERIVRRSKKDD
jgi:hypothetical protein